MKKEETAPKPAPASSRRTAMMVGGTVVLMAVVAVLAARKPSVDASQRPSPTAVERRPGELQAAQDSLGHHAPGSPAAVAETFLRHWFRAHYDQAAALSTGAVEARCRRNLAQLSNLTPDLREELRQVQLISEAAQFDLERAVTTEVDAGATTTRAVDGVLHAHGPSPDGRPVESRRGQHLVLVLRDGAWKVSEWTPAPGEADIHVGGQQRP